MTVGSLLCISVCSMHSIIADAALVHVGQCYWQSVRVGVKDCSCTAYV